MKLEEIIENCIESAKKKQRTLLQKLQHCQRH